MIYFLIESLFQQHTDQVNNFKIQHKLCYITLHFFLFLHKSHVGT